MPNVTYKSCYYLYEYQEIWPDIRFEISPRKIVQISCKTFRSRDNFLYFEHISEQLTVISFSDPFLTVNTVVYVYRDNEPVKGRI